MLWWNLEADHQWTWILKMLNSRMLQRKLALVILKKRQNRVTMIPLKAKEIEIVQNQIMMNLQYESAKNFRIYEVNILERKTESDLIKERPPFLYFSKKKKTVYNIFKRFREKGAYIRKKDQEGNLIEMMI